MTSLTWTRGGGWWGVLRREEASFSLGALGSARSEVTSLLGRATRQGQNHSRSTGGSDNMMRESFLFKLMVDGGYSEGRLPEMLLPVIFGKIIGSVLSSLYLLFSLFL